MATTNGGMPSGDAAFLDLIEHVAQGTSVARSGDEALLTGVRRVCEWTGWPAGCVYRVGSGTVVTYIARGAELGDVRAQLQHEPLVRGAGLAGRALATGFAQYSADVGPGLRAAGLRGGLAVPIDAGTRALAVLEFFWTADESVGPTLLAAATHLGRQLGRVARELDIKQALRESESRFRSVAESTSDAIIVADERGRITSWNRAAHELFGYATDEVLDEPLTMLMPERFHARHDAGLRRIVHQGRSVAQTLGRTFEVAGLRRDGTEFPIELSLSTWTTGERRYFSGIIRDISARKHAEAQARALDAAPDSIVRIDERRAILVANARTGQLFGYSADELAARPVIDLFATRSQARLADRLDAVRARPGARESLELTGRRKDGSEFPADVTLRSQDGDDGVVVSGSFGDATERKRFEQQLAHLSTHDALTGLWNRQRFEEELGDYAAYAARFGGFGAVLVLDLDRFKYVNDVRGQRAGDDVIRAVAHELASHIRDTDVLARLGGDEFAVLLKHTDRPTAERRAADVLGAVCRRGAASGLALTASIGIAPFDGENRPAEDLLAAADMAMYAAKAAGGDRHHMFAGDDAHVVAMRTRQRRAEQIRCALDDDRFTLYWQPIVDLATGEATHRELLLRMLGPCGEVIAPGAFIETAERFGLIREVDRWVIEHAIELLPHVGGMLEVNLSAASVCDPALPELVERRIAQAGADASRLIFEITETQAIANLDQARTFAERMGRLGCKFALDDFGAGFSSFHYLKRLPLDYIKIDGEFIRALTVNLQDQLIVKSIVDIAHGMGMSTIAEFVEDAGTVAMLRRLGVEFSQGYHHGRPAPVSAGVPRPVGNRSRQLG